MADDLITRVSDRGEIALPDAVLERQHWDAGTKLIVEETPEGVLLKKRSPFPPTKPSDVFGMLKDKYKGPPKSVEEMNEGILEEAGRSFLKSIDSDS